MVSTLLGSVLDVVRSEVNIWFDWVLVSSGYSTGYRDWDMADNETTGCRNFDT